MSRTWRLAAVAAGGALGAAARYGVAAAWPSPRYGFDWPTFAANALGCGLIGVLMVLVAETGPGRPLLRLFLGVGVLGGFTTYSTYAVGGYRLIAAGRVGLAAAYLAGTILAALAATWLGVVATRRLTRGAR